jgi:hypothetical protein
VLDAALAKPKNELPETVSVVPAQIAAVDDKLPERAVDSAVIEPSSGSVIFAASLESLTSRGP